MVGIQRTLGESPTRFKPLLYMPEDKARNEKTPPEGSAWCEGYMAGVKLRDDEWQPLYDALDARDWIFPIEALAFGDQDPEFADGPIGKRGEIIGNLANDSARFHAREPSCGNTFDTMDQAQKASRDCRGRIAVAVVIHGKTNPAFVVAGGKRAGQRNAQRFIG